MIRDDLKEFLLQNGYTEGRLTKEEAKNLFDNPKHFLYRLGTKFWEWDFYETSVVCSYIYSGYFSHPDIKEYQYSDMIIVDNKLFVVKDI